MKNIFTLLFLFLVLFTLKAQNKQAPVEDLYPEDVFKYDQVLPANQAPDHTPKCENYILDVMFQDDAKVRFRDGELTDLLTDATAGVQQILGKLQWFEWERFSEVSEEFLDELSENGSSRTGQQVYNLNNIYRLRVPEQDNIWALSMELESLPGIIYARPVPKPAELPVPPSYLDNQGYLDPADDVPSGIDAEYAWTRSGGTGTGIKICDLEYSWNYNHADITKAVGSQINSNIADPFNSNHHGTAVIGVLVSNNNGWGTTGATYNSTLRTCGTYYGSPSPTYNPGGAITLSISNLVAGDIILLEQQFDYTGSEGYVPIEWYGNYSPNAQTNNPVYAAIVNAVANGIHVVEAGGNGNVNTGDLTWYGNSGAVIVGAGGGFVGDNLKKLNFSSYGPRFDVQGWGENVTTTGYGSLYSTEGVNYYYTSSFSGTSSASPIVTSAIACFSGYWKSIISATPPTPANMRAILKRHGRPQVNPDDGYIGTRPNIEAMIKGYMYCAASGGCDEYISRVQMGDIDNSSDCDGYVDYTSIFTDNLPLNLSHTLTVTNGHPFSSDQCGVWVDWNRDGDFSDASETITVSGNPGYGPYTATITPPATATAGEVRMRVRIIYTGTLSACGNTTYGEVEDYTLNLTSKVPNVWTGGFNYYWHNAGNWSLGHIPTADEDVIMTSAGYHPPSVSIYDDACKNLTIQSGAGLNIGDKTLTVNGDLDINGNLAMNNSAGVLTVSGDVAWLSGSTANFTASSAFHVYGNWDFMNGSNVNLANGTVLFWGTSNKYIGNYSSNSSFFNVGSYKSGGFEVGISNWSTQPLTIKGYMYVHPGAQFGVYSNYDVILKGDVNSNGVFICNFGKIKLDGASQQLRMNTDNYFNNLTFSQTGTVTINNSLSSILDVNGSVVIESGVFSLQDRTMRVKGDWTNSVGTAAFNEVTGRVIFDAPAHQYIKTSETFYIIEANMGAALRLDNVSTVVTCSQYDWTSGGIDVGAGTFTALDLADNGLYGTFWCNPAGAINLTQDNSQYTDLHGEIHIYGGTMTVTGGLGQSYWPYFNNATIEMTGGILDFKNNGIKLYNGSNTLTENISGGTIRTNGSFTGDRADFTPYGGTIELYGNSDVQLSHGVGSNFYSVWINKSASIDESGNILEERFYDRNGNLIDGSRANTVSSTSDLILMSNMVIENGQLTAPSSIKLKGNWLNSVGTAGFAEGTGTVTFNGNDHQFCYGETFNVLELNKPIMDLHIPGGTTTSCQVYDWNSGELEVEGGTFIANDLFDSGIFGNYYLTSAGGLIELHQDLAQFVDLNGKVVINNGTMNIYGGNGYSYWPYNNNAALWMSGGVLDFKDNGIWIYSTALTLDDQITGGTIRMSKGLIADRADFTPTAGTFEFYGNSDFTISESNGCTLKNVKINKFAADGGGNSSGEPVYDKRSGAIISDGGKSNTINLGSNFTITGNLEIAAGTFNMSSYTCTVTGTTDIYGTLAMTNAANDLNSGEINWNNGSNDIVTAGTFHADDWRFNEGTNALLGTGNTAYINNLFYPTDSDAEFGNLVAIPYSKVSEDMGGGKAYYPIRVAGNFTAQNGSAWYLYNSLTDVIVAGNSQIQSGSEINFSSADFNTSGSLDISGNLIVSNGSVVMVGGNVTFPSTGWLYMTNGTFTCTYNVVSGFTSLDGKLSMSESSVLEFPGRSVGIGNAFVNEISGGIIRIGRTLGASAAGNFQLNSGTVEFVTGNSGHYVQVVNGNYLNDVTVNKPGGSMLVYDNLIIKGDLNINAGVLNSNNKTISIAGDWNNNVGISAFDETNGTVVFNGSGAQMCTSEDFYILEMNKPLELLYNTSYSTITCQVYDWVSGGLWISPGNFSAADLADNGLYGTYAIFGGTMDLHQGTDQYVDINGSVTVGSGGYFNVYGGITDSWWGIDDNTIITMTGGVIDFKNVGINIYNSPYFTFEENITAGTIRTAGMFLVSNTGFTPTGGSVELYGGITAYVATAAGCNLYNLTINKTGGSKDVQPAIYPDRMGNIYPEGRANQVIMIDNVLINGNLSTTAGELYSGNSGYILSCMGNVTIGSGSTLKLWANSQLKLNAALNVNSGGSFVAQGDAGFETKISRVSTNYYTFNVNSGGSISAESTIFEYMGANGINVASGAAVDWTNSFNNCTFQNGASGQTLLTMNCDQEFECSGAKFPANTWAGASNVTKSQNAGRITFINYSGGFSGSAYEVDPFSRVDWYVPTLLVSPLVRNVSTSAGSTTFSITSNLNWTVSESVAWFSVSPMSGNSNATLTVNYQQNTSLTARSGQITISAPDVPDVVVTVNQAGASVNLSVSPTNRDVSPAAGSTTFAISANTGWTVSESVSWFSVSPATGSGNGTLTVDYGENATGSTRVGSITVTAFGGSPSQTVTVTQESYPTHLISVPEGWSGLSSYIMPVNNDITDIFSPVSGNFVIATTMTGMYYPAGPVNTIIDWESQSAYSVKMNAASTLPIIGNAETNKTFPLASGWNLLPVISNANVTTSTLVSGLGVNLNIIKEIAGTKVYWPAFGIFTLNQLTPGKAYFVRMADAGSVTFPANVADNLFIPDEPVKELETPWNEIQRTAGSHIIGISVQALSDFNEGDIIGIFTTEGICAGNVLIRTTSETHALYAFADDQLTSETDGFTDGQPMFFKLFRPSTGEECNLDVVYNSEMPNNDGLFATDGISAISNITFLNTGINNHFAKDLYIYPNPTNDRVIIGGITGIEQVLVMSAEGAVVMRFAPKTEGNQVLDLSGLPAGFYQVQIRTSQGVVTRKVVKGM